MESRARSAPSSAVVNERLVQVLADDERLELHDSTHTHERMEAFDEFDRALGDDMFQRQELHLDTVQLHEIMKQFNHTIESTLRDDSDEEA